MKQKDTYTPAIVVVAYNRSDSLERLLKSLNKAFFYSTTSLVISIDHGDNKAVVNVANDFQWKHGEKTITYQGKNLGLRNHILKCGNLTKKFGSIILLEDDLYVSPNFYNYAVSALNYYDSDDSIGGISLYNHKFNETARFPFTPIEDGSDVYFLQIASSWGQAWTEKQWLSFYTWYSDTKPEIEQNSDLPKDVISWHESSWKKFFIKFLVDHKKYFVYPRKSLTTNFSDVSGTNAVITCVLQVPLLYNIEKGESKFNFTQRSSSYAVYDAHCELLSEKLSQLNTELDVLDFEVDLYGTKPLSKIISKHVITSKKSSRPLQTFGCSLKPLEMNIIEGINGDDFVLTKTKNVKNNQRSSFLRFGKQFGYFYRDLSRYDLLKLFIYSFSIIIKRLLFK